MTPLGVFAELLLHREVQPRDVARVLLKELRISILLALVLALIAFGRVLVFGGGSSLPPRYGVMQIGLAVAVALGLEVVSATLIGALLPLGAARLRQDPAVIASPALTTVVDITGLLIYFTTARILIAV